MEDTTTTPPLPPRAERVLRLAEIIRELGVCITSHGAAALAEAILAHPGFSGWHYGPAAQPADQTEGPSLADVDDLCAEFSFHYEDGDSLVILQEMITAAITRWPAPAAEPVATPPPLPPDYIDLEHHGEDHKLLEAFYQGARLDSGTADEIVLRGIRRVLALRPTVGAVRAADAAIAEVALEAEFRAWWNAKVHIPSADYRARHACATHVAWGRHLLSRVEL